MKLSTKLALLVFFSMFFVIMTMGTCFYLLSKSFYKEQLQTDIEQRLSAHREVIEMHLTNETMEHVILMEERREENTFIIFDRDLNVLYNTQSNSEEMLERYRKWLNAAEEKEQHTEFVKTITHHIPHIWSFEPFIVNKTVEGYLFIDQDTGNFEQARAKLLAITTGMGVFTLILSGLLTIFFSNKITLPLIHARQLTKRIALGDFEVELSGKGQDEIADLMADISSMAGQLKEYRDTRQQFLTNISHDLRTPLTYMKGYAALLKDQNAEPKLVKEQASVIHQEAIRMEGLVYDLFQLMKLEEGKVQINLQEINLLSFIEELTKKAALAVNEKGIKLLVMSSDSVISAAIDPEQFERALLNLLMNSIRHTPVSGKIIIRISQNKRKTTIAIEDNGEGISAEHLVHIWERFYRVDKSRTSKQGGSGLGLAITKHIIELHGGTIEVESTVHQGTTFTITLFKKD